MENLINYRLSSAPTELPSEKLDFDFWYNPTYNNYFNLLNALEELGQDVSEYKCEQSPNPHKSFFRFELEIATIDFLPSIPGLSKFTTCYNKRELVSFDGLDIPIIAYEDLIISKKTIGRKKDIEDIDQLSLRHNKSRDGEDGGRS